jgi:hypothetical protein
MILLPIDAAVRGANVLFTKVLADCEASAGKVREIQ